MIDWHTHILPNMDDGSRDTEESIALLRMQASQGIDTVVATPHFYANDGSVESFLDRRRRAFESLKPALFEGLPMIVLGAEVKYYQGISRMESLSALRMEGTRLLLLEMPVTAWTESMIRELEEMSRNTPVILAHIERYYRLQKQSVWERLLASGVLMQANADFFVSLASRRKALSLLREGHIHFVGSDCHNVLSRPPRIGQAYECIQKKLGKEYLRQMNEYGQSMLAAINS